MSILKEIDDQLKKQPGKRYRMVRLDKENVSAKAHRGYEFVLPGDPEVKGTNLEKIHAADGKVTFGNLALARISEKRARELEKQNQDRLELRMKAIKEGYRRKGEEIKRALGSSHKNFDVIVEEEE